MTNSPTYPTATPEIVWAALLELKESQAETNRQIKETDRILKEKFAETDRQIKKVTEMVGSWSNNHGAFAEEYFYNSFENGKQNFFGEKVDELFKNIKGIEKGFKDEYDLLLINGKYVRDCRSKIQGARK